MFNRMISERREMFSSREENRIMDIIEAGPMAKYGAYDLSSEINYVNKDILHTQNKYVIIHKNIYKEK